MSSVFCRLTKVGLLLTAFLLVAALRLGYMVRFFFFSSRRRHTRFDCDWSSDVCSSDLFPDRILADARQPQIESATLQTVFRNLHRARRSAEVAVQKFRQFADTTVDAG